MCDMVLDNGMKAAAEMGAWVQGSLGGHGVGRKNSPFYRRFGRTFYEWNDGDEERAERFAKAMEGWSDGELIVV